MLNNSQVTQLTLALAGLAQAATLVQTFAKNGTYDQDAFETSINSIYKLDADSTLSIYGSTAHLRLGLETLLDLFTKKKFQQASDVPRYVISLIHLSTLLMKDKVMLKDLEKKLQYVISQTSFFHPYHETVIANLGQIYSDTIGTFKFKIQIIGKPDILNRPQNMGIVRCLLLAGIRSGVLWRQLGGSQLHLLFLRKKIIDCAKTLLKSVEHSE